MKRLSQTEDSPDCILFAILAIARSYVTKACLGYTVFAISIERFMVSFTTSVLWVVAVLASYSKQFVFPEAWSS